MTDRQLPPSSPGRPGGQPPFGGTSSSADPTAPSGTFPPPSSPGRPGGQPPMPAGVFGPPPVPGQNGGTDPYPAPWEPSPKKTPKAVAVAIAVGGCLVVAAAVFCMVAVGADVLARAADGFAQLRQEAAAPPTAGGGALPRRSVLPRFRTSAKVGTRTRRARMRRPRTRWARKGFLMDGTRRRATRLRKRRSHSSSTRT